jgi:hypothetical protein
MMLDPITMHRLTQDIFSGRLKSFEDAQRAAMMTTEPRFPRLNAAVSRLRQHLQRPTSITPVAQPAVIRRTATQEVACVNC